MQLVLRSRRAAADFFSHRHHLFPVAAAASLLASAITFRHHPSPSQISPISTRRLLALPFARCFHPAARLPLSGGCQEAAATWSRRPPPHAVSLHPPLALFHLSCDCGLAPSHHWRTLVQVSQAACEPRIFIYCPMAPEIQVAYSLTKLTRKSDAY